MYYIYIITNLINNKQYVGQRKWNKDPNIDKYMGSGTALNRSYNKYGIDNFKKELIKTDIKTRDDADKYEKIYIILYNTKAPNGYNLTNGGEGGKLIHHTEEVKSKMCGKQAWNKGLKNWRPDYIMSKDTKDKIGNHHRNKIVSTETKLKMSASAKKRNAPNKGKKFTDKHRKNLSESHKGQTAWNKGLNGWHYSEEDKIRLYSNRKRRTKKP